MRTIRFLLQKEFLQIFRDKGMLPIIFLMPLIQLIILGNAATYEIKNIDIYIVNKDRTPVSRRLEEDFLSTKYFTISGYSSQVSEAKKSMQEGDTDMILVIPRHFERDLKNKHFDKLDMLFNAENGNSAAVSQTYAQSIVQRFTRQWQRNHPSLTPVKPQKLINIDTVNWYNPELDYTSYMVPGILVILVTMIGMFLSGMNIVKEKEVGTIEQLNVTPIKRYQFIIGKLAPFWILGLGELAFGLFAAWIIFGIPMVGSLVLVFFVAAIYLLVVLGLGLFISTMTDTQQQAMFIAWFLMVVFILMGGLFTPIESMPVWAQKVTFFNPIAHFIEVMRRVLVKGAHISDIKNQIIVLGSFAIAIIALAVSRYKKVSA
ncbi:MAG TPA: ABC transporter permease [Balneolales bacterium]|nr:ABC transporter permease [Balneolales bacterium]